MKTTSLIALLFAVSSKAVAAPDYTDLLYENRAEDTAVIMSSHISNGYRFDLLSPLVMTDYGGSNINTPHGEEAVHGTFMVVTSEETGEVAYFERDEEYQLSKGFIFKNQLTEESLKELQRGGIDPDRIDIMIWTNNGGNGAACGIKTIFFKTLSSLEVLGSMCGKNPDTWIRMK